MEIENRIKIKNFDWNVYEIMRKEKRMKIIDFKLFNNYKEFDHITTMKSHRSSEFSSSSPFLSKVPNFSTLCRVR